MSASAKQVSQLAGFLMHISFAVRPGSFFVHRLLAPAGMPSIAAGLDFSDRMANPGRRVALGPEFHGDRGVWPWFVDEVLNEIGGTLLAPTYHPRARTPVTAPKSRTGSTGNCRARLTKEPLSPTAADAPVPSADNSPRHK